eukprot:120470_1
MATVQADSLSFLNLITNSPKYNVPCRYNPTYKGCRYGQSCYFQHFTTQPPISTKNPQIQQIQQIPPQNTWNNKYYKYTNTNQIPLTPQITHETFNQFMDILFKKINDMVNILTTIMTIHKIQSKQIQKQLKNV